MSAASTDPIVAIATPPGRGGIGVVRVSGSDLGPIVEGLLGPRAAQALLPRRAVLAKFLDANGEPIDQGIALLFPAPHSFTGETVLELQGHGGPVIMQMLAARCVEAGRGLRARWAQPGEFSLRAFLNGRMDLAQAEAVADLIDASTQAAARSAMRSLRGAFSQAVHALVSQLIELRTLVEATLDFPEEEIEFLRASDALGRLEAARAALAQLLEQAQRGAVLREGLHVVLVGAPNVGKSSLLNALAQEEVAIVTPIAGTTRDRIVHAVAVQGVPVHLVDTAGLRHTEDVVERLGIERTLAEVARADVLLHLVDATAPQAAAGDDEVLRLMQAHLPAGVARLTVVNKIDVSGDEAGRQADGRVCVSALTGAGLEALRTALLAVAGGAQGGAEHAILARERHLEALRTASAHLDAANALSHAHQGDQALELFAEELRLAAQALAAITGEFGVEDLLGQIFSRFCIGK